ncbi:TIGR04104 family putative zinc finger protein [Halalkalibacter alkaliphilus]|uniref:Cxxc_20_cxxc protein n=1 Tax=Halalkalibacter alkaliphilus TaxID=2917993 RepID=A0A9X2CWL5_9BACI|nr:TIGR04104 family putative zinc finger protein [Halalkalibacter alkaliphilus]MCL7749583.1 hypothetical protein [Halalkalibacter alkaliphilus]
MRLPHCWNCNNLFKYRELFFFLKSKQCSKCGKQNYVTAKRRLRNAWSSPFVVILMFSGFYLFNMTIPIAILYGIFIIFIGMLIGPFTYEFTGSDEALFD